jgi:uncharacterized protein DUF3551
MRTATGLLLALPLALLARTDAAQAQSYPWCAQYAILGSVNCGFVTLEQCNAALSGNGGYCAPNPFLRPSAEYLPPARPRR